MYIRSNVEILLGCVPVMLHVYWLLAAGAAVAAHLPITPDTFRQAVALSASRGKTWDSRPRHGLGLATEWTTPQSWFSHFYLLGLAAIAAVIYLYVGMSGQGCQAATIVALLLLTVHLSRRALETLFMMRYPSRARMHVIAYVFGLSYYLALPMSMVESSFFRSRPLTSGRKLDIRAFSTLTGLEWPAIVGMMVFVVGNVLQVQTHYQLAQLHTKGAKHTRPHTSHSRPERPAETQSRPATAVRHRAVPTAEAGPQQRDNGQSPVNRADQDYVIPTGGLFELVSCPHYLAELIIYLGLLGIVGPYSWLPWLIMAWLVANLSLAAEATHKWYHRTFPDYPAQRKALFPFVR